MRNVLRSLVGEAASRADEGADAQPAPADAPVDPPHVGADDYTGDERLDEVVSLVRAQIPGASLEAIREYVQMIDDRKLAARKMAERSLIERLPDPKPATLGRRVGPTPEVLAEEIVEGLRHERR